MIDNVVSFIIPNRGGKDLAKVIKNINDVYSDLNKEILVIQQEDNLPFMRGQLYNIGVKFSTGNYVALTDNDIYHFRELPLFLIYKAYKKPIIGFKYISQVDYNNGNIKVVKNQLMLHGMGAFNFMAKTDFMKVNGFSNLYIGWGQEDYEFMKRFNNDFCRVPQHIGHLMHPHRANVNPKNTELNRQLFKEFDKRNYLEDGIKQTTFDLISEEQKDGYKLIKVNHISTVKDFKYQQIIEKHFKLCGR